MKFGVILPTFGPGASRMGILDAAHAAEDLGYDSIWVTDHLALPKEDAERFGHIFEALTTLSYLAASTRRVRLGISTLVLPQRNPVEVAKEIATLDALSAGRVIFSAGIGWSRGEYANLGYNFSDRARRMDEALKVLRTLWRGGKSISFSGDYYHFQNLVLSPPPVQSGGPPLWVAGDAPAALRRAVYYGDGWHPNGRSPAALADALASVKHLLANRPFTVSMRIRLDFSDSAVDESTLSGSPAQVVQKLQAFRQAGLEYAVLSIPAESHGARERSMQLFQKEVAPALEGD